jgi:hypothetical protein
MREDVGRSRQAGSPPHAAEATVPLAEVAGRLVALRPVALSRDQ